MFLHIGKNVYILKKDIVAILDKDSIDESQDSNIFIKKFIEENLNNEDLNSIRTYIITSKNINSKRNGRFKERYNLYTSNISSTTLLKRNKDIETILEV